MLYIKINQAGEIIPLISFQVGLPQSNCIYSRASEEYLFTVCDESLQEYFKRIAICGQRCTNIELAPGVVVAKITGLHVDVCIHDAINGQGDLVDSKVFRIVVFPSNTAMKAFLPELSDICLLLGTNDLEQFGYTHFTSTGLYLND